MSSFNRRTLIFLPLALSACGFTPVYGTSGSGDTLQNNVEVVAPKNLNGYLVGRRLEERLGRASEPTYRLSLSVSAKREGLGINSESNINRYNLIGEARYNLVNVSNGKTVASGEVDNFTGSSATGTTVATLAAERDARERLMTLLADQVVTRLLSTDLS